MGLSTQLFMTHTSPCRASREPLHFKTSKSDARRCPTSFRASLPDRRPRSPFDGQTPARWSSSRMDVHQPVSGSPAAAFSLRIALFAAGKRAGRAPSGCHAGSPRSPRCCRRRPDGRCPPARAYGPHRPSGRSTFSGLIVSADREPPGQIRWCTSSICARRTRCSGLPAYLTPQREHLPTGIASFGRDGCSMQPVVHRQATAVPERCATIGSTLGAGSGVRRASPSARSPTAAHLSSRMEIIGEERTAQSARRRCTSDDHRRKHPRLFCAACPARLVATILHLKCIVLRGCDDEVRSPCAMS